MDYIDLNIYDEDKPLGRRRVDKYVIDDPNDAAMYEDLLNKEDINILDEQFSYDRAGRAVITVW